MSDLASGLPPSDCCCCLAERSTGWLLLLLLLPVLPAFGAALGDELFLSFFRLSAAFSRCCCRCSRNCCCCCSCCWWAAATADAAAKLWSSSLWPKVGFRMLSMEKGRGRLLLASWCCWL